MNIRTWPRSVARVLATSTATPLERAALLMAACRSRSLPARLLLPRRWVAAGERTLAAEELGDPLLLVELGSDAEGRMSDPVAGRLLPAGAQPPQGAILAGPETESLLLPAPVPTPWDVQLAMHWDLADGTLRAVGDLLTPPDLQTGLERPEQYLTQWVQGWGDSAALLDLRLDEGGPERLRFQLRARLPLPAPDTHGIVHLALPLPPLPLDTLLPPGMRRSHSACRARLFPARPAALQLSWSLALPPKLAALASPGTGAACPGGRFAVTRGPGGETAPLDVHYDLEWDGSPVSTDDYPALRKFINAALDPAATRVLLSTQD